MDHVRQIDWCSSQPDLHFVAENELDNCVTERILGNRFRDPLVSSDSENESPVKINWDEVFKQKKNGDKFQRVYVPGLRPPPPFPKLSALTAVQHYQCLKVLCAQNPNVLEAEFFPRPTKQDYRVFEEVKETYLQEQKEFLEWSKAQWINRQCIRALRPKPLIETVYEAEFKMRAHGIQGYPRTYELAAQLSLESRDHVYDMVGGKELVTVNISELPMVYVPELIVKRFTVQRACAVPEPCVKHPVHFQLPNEQSKSILPLLEVHKELAQYALDNGVHIIASENALKCLVELDRAWNFPISVCPAIAPDGDIHNVIVLGSEFTLHKEPAPRRTYKAYRHLLQHAIVPPSEQAKLMKRGVTVSPSKDSQATDNNDMDMSSDDEDGDSLIIDDGGLEEQEEASDVETEEEEKSEDTTEPADKEPPKDEAPATSAAPAGGNTARIGVYNCVCKDTLYERPPPRSFKKWQIKDLTTSETHELIVHCTHKVRGNVGELILEPIPEYQIELGGTRQSAEKLKSLALSLKLRRNASLLIVRVESQSGDVVTFDNVYSEQLADRHGPLLPAAAAALHAALRPLGALRRGCFLLRHEASHGTNALLFVARMGGSLCLRALPVPRGPPAALAGSDQAASVKAAPVLEPVLLPIHKFRKILPMAFTPHQSQVAKEPKKPVTRQKTPPQALKWPKRKRKAKSKN